jgi:UDP-N-acetylglucosamine 2-epimerase (non-hydrolysing)
LTEGVESYRLKLTGNSIVSAIARYSKAKPVRPPLARILITLHRREWLLGEQFQHVLDALRQSARDDPRVDFVWPLHPAVQKRIAREWVDSLPPNLVLVTPLAYADSVGVLAECLGVLTDSGGLMEEAATLGVPCACLRNVCDRPEAIDAGVARLFFVNATGVERAVKALVSGELQRRPTDVYGDITAASQIAQHLCMLAA